MFFHPQLQNEAWMREQVKTKTAREIATEVGCSHSAVMYAVKKFSLVLPRPNRRGDHAPSILYEKLQDKEWLVQQVQLKSAREIGREVGSSTGAVMYAINKFAISIPKRTPDGVGGAFFRFPQLQDESWIREQVASKPLRQIADEVGSSYGAIVHAVRKFGIAVPQRTKVRSLVDRSAINSAAKQRWRSRLGMDAPNWRGGKRQSSSGYTYVYCPNHPHCTAEGYVMEHRLVAEDELKRYLKPHEIVHHKNGIKTDNSPANLEVIASKKRHAQVHFEAVKELDALRQRIAELESQIKKQ